MTRLATLSAPEDALAWHVRLLGLPDPVREHRFHNGRRWRFDFAWTHLRLAVEVEGGTWTGGRHVRGAGFELDCVKYAEAAIDGWCVLRVTSAMVSDGRAIDLVERAIRARTAGGTWTDARGSGSADDPRAQPLSVAGSRGDR